jgi:flavin-dependent dehydrogenase
MPAHNRSQPVVIAGGGPAGSSLAIRLAENGLPVVLVERETFPRQKLCGEFISPECLTHFESLGVLDPMLASGGDRVSETIFYGLNGTSISVSSKLFGSDALSLSRSAMDFILLERARSLGVTIYENSTIRNVDIGRNGIDCLTIRTNDNMVDLQPSMVVDATGRSRAVTKLAARQRNGQARTKSETARLVGFKAHFRNAAVPRGRCEIYSFPGGYGGLSNVEDGLSNHCFLVKAELAKACGDADRIVQNVAFQNPRARRTLGPAVRDGEWLAVSVSSFGLENPAPLPGIFTVGDAAAFIDPFTGSGMLMALESSEILARSIVDHPDSRESVARIYVSLYRSHFRRRLAVCRVLRHAAFMPAVASSVIRILSASETLRSCLARATRPVGSA